MAATTPTGSRLTTPVPSVVRPCAFGVSSIGSDVTAGRDATSTVRRACFIGMPYCRNSASIRVAPASATIMSTIAALRASSASRKRVRIFCRSATGRCGQSPWSKAWRAAPIAASTCAALPTGASISRLSSAGLITASRWSVFCHSPPI